MPNRSSFAKVRIAVLLLIALLLPSAARADVVFPALVYVWPIMILIFIPIVLIETLYTWKRLGMGFWKIAWVTTIANLLSSLAGLPIATVIAGGLEYLLESIVRYNSPRWIVIVSAISMMVVCFLVSWWIEGKWLQHYIKRTIPASADRCMTIARNANLLSYAFLTVLVVWTLLSAGFRV